MKWNSLLNILKWLPVAVTPVPTTTYAAKYFWPFFNASWDFSVQAPILFSAVGDFFGPGGNTYVYGTMILTTIGLIWIRTEDSAIPLTLLFVIGNVLFWSPGIVPTSWLWTIRALMYLTLAGIAYVVWRGRRLS